MSELRIEDALLDIHDISYDYYGKRVATCSSDQMIRIFDSKGDRRPLTIHCSLCLIGSYLLRPKDCRVEGPLGLDLAPCLGAPRVWTGGHPSCKQLEQQVISDLKPND